MLISFLTDRRVRRYFAFKYRFVAGFIIFHLSDDNNIYLIGIFVNALNLYSIKCKKYVILVTAQEMSDNERRCAGG